MQTATKKETALGIRQMAMIGVMTAVTCIAAPFSIPILVSPVPLSLTTFILYLSVYILGTRNAFISYVIYLLLGLVGLPVFSGFSGCTVGNGFSVPPPPGFSGSGFFIVRSKPQTLQMASLSSSYAGLCFSSNAAHRLHTLQCPSAS